MMEKKRMHPARAVLLTVLCVVLTLCLGTGLLSTCLTRSYVKRGSIPSAVRAVSLADLEVQEENGQRKSAAQYILDHYVQDDRVTPENVERVLRDGTFTDYAGDLVAQYNDYLRGTADFPELTADSVVGLIEENEVLIREETGLQFLDPDKEKLRQNLEQPLDEANRVLEHSLYVGVSGISARAQAKLWPTIVYSILLLAVFLWLVTIHVRWKGSAAGACKVFAVTMLFPCLGTLLTGAAGKAVLHGTGLDAFSGSFSVLRPQLLSVGIIGLLGCIVLFGAGVLLGLRRPKAVPAPAPADARAQAQRSAPFLHTPDVQEKQESAAPAGTDSSADVRRFCRFCGKPLVGPDAMFCYQCGRSQTTSDPS